MQHQTRTDALTHTFIIHRLGIKYIRKCSEFITLYSGRLNHTWDVCERVHVHVLDPSLSVHCQQFYSNGNLKHTHAWLSLSGVHARDFPHGKMNAWGGNIRGQWRRLGLVTAHCLFCKGCMSLLFFWGFVLFCLTVLEQVTGAAALVGSHVKGVASCVLSVPLCFSGGWRVFGGNNIKLGMCVCINC